jgi:hypothetical protein
VSRCNNSNGHTKCSAFYCSSCWPHTTHHFCVNSPNGIWPVSQAIGSSRPLRGAIECRWSGWQTTAHLYSSLYKTKLLGGYATCRAGVLPRGRPVCKTLQGRALTFNAPSRDACKFSSVWQSDFRGRALKGGGEQTPRQFYASALACSAQNFRY